MLKKKEFTWGPIEERAWNSAKALSVLGLKLTVPNPEDDLILTTDASKVAAAGCLFTVESKTEKWNWYQSHQNISAPQIWENVHMCWKASA